MLETIVIGSVTCSVLAVGASVLLVKKVKDFDEEDELASKHNKFIVRAREALKRNPPTRHRCDE